MKYTVMLGAMIAFFAYPVQADDFGARFFGEAPSAFDNPDENPGPDGALENGLDQASQEIFRPELIEPAAGDYFDSEAQDQIPQDVLEDAQDAVSEIKDGVSPQ